MGILGSVFVAILICLSVILFLTEALRVDLVAMIVLVLVMMLGLATPREALAGFGNPATITVAAMYILSAGLERSGALAPTSRWLRVLISTRGPRLSLLGLLVVSGVVSALINNTAAVAIFLPAVMSATRKANVSPSRYLLALSFISMAGGTITLVGTSTNLLVNGIAQERGLQGFTMFEFAPLGVLLFLTTLTYMLTVGYWLTPERRHPRDLTEDFELGPEDQLEEEPAQRRNEEANTKTALVEAEVSSGAEGMTLRASNVGKTFEAVPLALERRGRLMHKGLEDFPLRGGDTVLFQVDRERLDQLRVSGSFLVLSESDREVKPLKAAVSVLVVLGVVLLAALGVTPIVVAATAGSLLLVLSGCLNADEAYRAVDWKVIFLLAGMLSLGTAMENSGAATGFALWLLEGIQDWGPLAVLGTLYCLTTLLTAGMSNNATAALLTPIAISLAEALQVSPRPFLAAVAFAASACFASPIGYQTNLMVYGPGRFRFSDFLKVGLPLNLMFLLISVFVIPRLWSF